MKRLALALTLVALPAMAQAITFDLPNLTYPASGASSQSCTVSGTQTGRCGTGN